MLSSYLKCRNGAATRRVSDRLRSGITVGVVLAFLNGQLTWAEGRPRLIPGAPLVTKQEPQTTPPPPQPGEVQQQPPAQQPLPEGGTTVVTVSVPNAPGLSIKVLDGEGASNVIGKRKKSSNSITVEVRDDKDQVVEGAVVTFIAPGDGPSVVFSTGLRTSTVITDAAGVAHTPGMKPVNGGAFQIQVSASFRGQTASTNVSQTNYDSAAEAKGEQPTLPSGQPPITNKPKTSLSGTTWAIIAGAGVAAAVGIGVGLGHKGSSSSTTGGASATIGGAGTPTVGAP